MKYLIVTALNILLVYNTNAQAYEFFIYKKHDRLNGLIILDYAKANLLVWSNSNIYDCGVYNVHYMQDTIVLDGSANQMPDVTLLRKRNKLINVSYVPLYCSNFHKVSEKRLRRIINKSHLHNLEKVCPYLKEILPL
jgi:hypothetical protein